MKKKHLGVAKCYCKSMKIQELHDTPRFTFLGLTRAPSFIRSSLVFMYFLTNWCPNENFINMFSSQNKRFSPVHTRWLMCVCFLKHFHLFNNILGIFNNITRNNNIQCHSLHTVRYIHICQVQVSKRGGVCLLSHFSFVSLSISITHHCDGKDISHKALFARRVQRDTTAKIWEIFKLSNAGTGHNRQYSVSEYHAIRNVALPGAYCLCSYPCSIYPFMKPWF